jgi:23S rRNA (guanine745-N1)-methyltransferase
MCDILKPSADTLIVDAGCGEGYYSCEIAQRGFAVAGFDLSKFATDAASKRAKKANLENAFFGVASVFELPIADNSAKAVVNIFAPCVNDEYYRVIDKGGYLIVACAGPDHLLGLKRAIYKEIHLNDMRADMPTSLKHLDSVHVKYDIELNTNESIKNLFAMTPYYWKTSPNDVKYDIELNTNESIKNLFAMTPYYWKTSPNDVKKLDYIDRLNTEIDVILEIYQKI